MVGSEIVLRFQATVLLFEEMEYFLVYKNNETTEIQIVLMVVVQTVK